MKERIKEMTGALEQLGRNGLILPMLMLSYSYMDIFASLVRLDVDADVKQKDFIAWVDRYMLPIGGCDLTALDLYAARCGILHTLSPTSRLSRKGEAREIMYVKDSTIAAQERQRFASQNRTHLVIVEIPVFLDAFVRAAECFFREIEADVALQERVRANARYIFKSE
jgi:hypothetical protein